MRFLPSLLAIIVLAGCSAAEAMTAADTAASSTVFFQIDAVSCTYSGPLPVTFMIGNVDAGTESLAPGQTSKGYAISDGQIVQARIAGWTSAHFTVPTTLWTLRTNVHITSGSVTQLITC